MRKISLAHVRDLTRSSLLRCGASEQHAAAITEILSAAERDGCSSHGLFRLPAFIEGCTGGKVNVTAVPVVSAPLPGVVRVDACGGFTQAAEEAGLPELVAKAKSQGVAMMGVCNARGMSGAMWYPAEQLAQQGLVAIVCCNSPGYVSAGVGSARRVFGTNPMAFGWPRPGGLPPYVWDQASSVMARGEIQVHQRDGIPLAEGAGVDPSGAPTTDPAQILAGAQLPFGAYKGANIAAMIELLSAALFGSDLAVDKPDGTPFEEYRRGIFIMAIDPSNLREEGSASDHGEALMQALLGTNEGGRLPGDRRRAHRQRVEGEGKEVEIPEELYERIGRMVAAHEGQAAAAPIGEEAVTAVASGEQAKVGMATVTVGGKQYTRGQVERGEVKIAGNFIVGVRVEDKSKTWEIKKAILDTLKEDGWQPKLPYSGGMPMFAGELTSELVQKLLGRDDIKYIEADGVVTIPGNRSAL